MGRSKKNNKKLTTPPRGAAKDDDRQWPVSADLAHRSLTTRTETKKNTSDLYHYKINDICLGKSCTNI